VVFAIIKRLVRSAFRAVGLDIRRVPRAPVRLLTVARPHRHVILDAHIKAVLAKQEIDLIIDVGANVGQFGSLIRDAGYQGRIVSIEPVRSSLEALNARVADDDDWTVMPIALGRARTQLAMNVPRNTVLASFLAPSEYGRERFPEGETETTELVEVHRLDEIFDTIAAPLTHPRTYLKLDTQGWDLEVLAGASGCLENVVALQTEISMVPIYDEMPDYLNALTQLDQLGFGVTGFFPVTRDASLRVIEFDCVLVRK